MANKNLFTKFASLAMAGALAFSGVPVTGLTGAFAAVTPTTTLTSVKYAKTVNGSEKVTTGEASGNGLASAPYTVELDYTGNVVTFTDFVAMSGTNITAPSQQTGALITAGDLGYKDQKPLYVLEEGSVTGSNLVGTHNMNISTSSGTTVTGANIQFKINRLSLNRENTTVLTADNSDALGAIEYNYDGLYHNPQEFIGGVLFDNVNSPNDKVTVSTGAGDVFWDGTQEKDVTYDTNGNVGTYTGYVEASTATGKLTDNAKKAVKFKINPQAVAEGARFEITVGNATVGGGNPDVKVVDKQLESKKKKDSTGYDYYTLVNGTDYEVQFVGSSTEGSKCNAIFTFKGNYTGSVTKGYTVVKDDKNLAAAEVTLKDKNYTYDGAVHQNPVSLVKLNGEKLNPGVDYDVTYSNGVADEDKVVSTGFTGSPKSAGTVTVTVTGKGDYAGTKTAQYTIDPLKLKDTMVVPATVTGFDGTAKTPAVTVTPFAGGAETIEVDKSGNTINTSTKKVSDNLILNYQNNIYAGTATAIVEGTGNFTGTASAEFVIDRKTLGSNDFDDIPNQVYTGSAIEPAITGKYTNGDGDEVALVLGDDFTVTYEKNVEVGNNTAKAIITGQGNFTTGTGTVNKSFAIKEAAYDLANAEVTLVTDSVEYDGANHVASVKSVKFTDAEGKVSTLTKGTDYDVDTKVAKEVGEYDVVIKAKSGSKYGGSQTKKFAITGYDVKDAGFSLKKSSVKYNGKNQKPELVVAEGTRYDKGNMTEGVDYEVSGIKEIKNVGKLTVKVTGLGGYAGTEKSLTFKVTKADQPMKVSTKTASVKASKVAKKNQTIKASKVFSVSKNQGSVSYKKTSGNSKIKVASNGKITVKKGLKKGTYTIKVKVTAKGNSNYNSGSKTVKATIKVK